MHFKDWFYRSFNRDWRVNMGALHFLAMAFYAFTLACWFYFEDFDLTRYMMLGIALIAVVNLVRDAVVAGNSKLEQNPAYPLKSGLLNVGLFIFCIVVFAASTYGREIDNSKRKANQAWILSEFCVENGVYRDDRLKECLQLASSTRVGICKLGTDPMQECELELRKRLNRPKSSGT